MAERKKRQTTNNSKKPTVPKKTTANNKKQEKIDKKQELLDSGFIGNDQLEFHEVFPVKLEHKQKNKHEFKICYFQCQEHLDKYLNRYKLRKNSYKISKTPKK